MEKRIVFQSLGHSDRAYTAYQDSTALWSDYNRSRESRIDGWAGQFDTYGDGLCQHSKEYPTLNEEMPDYLASLAAHLLDHPEHVEIVAQRFRVGMSLAKVRFAASLKWKQGGKPQYYSTSECKVTTAASKQYDKRWLPVEEWMNGSADALFRLLNRDYWSTLDSYAFAAWLQEQGDGVLDGVYFPHDFPPRCVGFGTGERETPVDTAALRTAYRACLHICRSYDERQEGEMHVKHYRERVLKVETEVPT